MIFLPPTINIHVVQPCNYSCQFCFAHFPKGEGLRPPLPTEWTQIISVLAANGAQKINFAGGEPTLYKFLPELIAHTKGLGLQASLVTNGTRLEACLARCQVMPDFIGLSIDSGSEATNARLGRGSGQHVAQTVYLANFIRRNGIRLKINTVVTRLAVDEDMGSLIRALRPERWKLFQVLPIAGENDGKVEELLISEEEFRAFVTRHLHLESLGLRVVPESNELMTASYGMIDPFGRFFDNALGRLRYSGPILQDGLSAAFSAVCYRHERFIERGGEYK